MRRLLLLRHAPTAATRASAFPRDEPLDARGAAAAARLRGRLPAEGDCYASAAERARRTAVLAGYDPICEPALAECDFGRWRGRTLAQVAGSEPDAVTRWMTDPASAPHGGESLTALIDRIGDWLDVQSRLTGSGVAVTHGGPVRAAVVHALGAPPEAFWRIDAAPLRVTELHAHDASWRLVRLNAAPG